MDGPFRFARMLGYCVTACCRQRFHQTMSCTCAIHHCLHNFEPRLPFPPLPLPRLPPGPLSWPTGSSFFGISSSLFRASPYTSLDGLSASSGDDDDSDDDSEGYISAFRETGSPSWLGLAPCPWIFSMASWRRGFSLCAALVFDADDLSDAEADSDEGIIMCDGYYGEGAEAGLQVDQGCVGCFRLGVG
jgi:hypothetical protein